MATLWENASGELIEDSGSLIECEDCPCGCEYLDGDTPAAVQLDLSGVVDGTCADCEYWNDTSFLIDDHDAGTCLWSENVGGWSCNGGTSNILVQILSDKIDITINLAGGGAVLFRKTITTPIDFASIGSVPYFSAAGPGATVCDFTGAAADVTAV